MVAAPPPPSVFEFPKHPLVAGKTASVDQRPPCSMFRPGEISKSDASSSRKGCASRTFSPLYVRPGRGTNVPLKNTLKSSAPKGQITFFFRGLSGVHGRGAPPPPNDDGARLIEGDAYQWNRLETREARRVWKEVSNGSRELFSRAHASRCIFASSSSWVQALSRFAVYMSRGEG